MGNNYKKKKKALKMTLLINHPTGTIMEKLTQKLMNITNVRSHMNMAPFKLVIL